MENEIQKLRFQVLTLPPPDRYLGFARDHVLELLDRPGHHLLFGSTCALVEVIFVCDDFRPAGPVVRPQPLKNKPRRVPGPRRGSKMGGEAAMIEAAKSFAHTLASEKVRDRTRTCFIRRAHKWIFRRCLSSGVVNETTTEVVSDNHCYSTTSEDEEELQDDRISNISSNSSMAVEPEVATSPSTTSQGVAPGGVQKVEQVPELEVPLSRTPLSSFQLQDLESPAYHSCVLLKGEESRNNTTSTRTSDHHQKSAVMPLVTDPLFVSPFTPVLIMPDEDKQMTTPSRSNKPMNRDNSYGSLSLSISSLLSEEDVNTPGDVVVGQHVSPSTEPLVLFQEECKTTAVMKPVIEENKSQDQEFESSTKIMEEDEDKSSLSTPTFGRSRLDEMNSSNNDQEQQLQEPVPTTPLMLVERTSSLGDDTDSSSPDCTLTFGGYGNNAFMEVFPGVEEDQRRPGDISAAPNAGDRRARGGTVELSLHHLANYVSNNATGRDELKQRVPHLLEDETINCALSPISYCSSGPEKMERMSEWTEAKLKRKLYRKFTGTGAQLWGNDFSASSAGEEAYQMERWLGEDEKLRLLRRSTVKTGRSTTTAVGTSVPEMRKNDAGTSVPEMRKNDAPGTTSVPEIKRRNDARRGRAGTSHAPVHEMCKLSLGRLAKNYSYSSSTRLPYVDRTSSSTSTKRGKRKTSRNARNSKSGERRRLQSEDLDPDRICRRTGRIMSKYDFFDSNFDFRLDYKYRMSTLSGK
ncbi:unnamed protein product [Amoebophrya sp. A120]|nr:unnamed protein product [Amoebophrya sp. A120]|eukprot:GSA120T00023416001.1